MTSGERIRLVLEHKIPDRVPSGLGGCETAGLHVLAYDNLRRALGVPCTPFTKLSIFSTLSKNNAYRSRRYFCLFIL